mmetsp:Transcript_6819/g.17642  ORF Transcript_6819/g.17642 Transcript_6819/m.17642 type:complete len:279 (+) Transcript_6819:99-935(+)
MPPLHLPHGASKVCAVRQADKSKAPVLLRAVLSHHLGLVEGLVVRECGREDLVRDLRAQVAHEDPEVVLRPLRERRVDPLLASDLPHEELPARLRPVALVRLPVALDHLGRRRRLRLRRHGEDRGPGQRERRLVLGSRDEEGHQQRGRRAGVRQQPLLRGPRSQQQHPAVLPAEPEDGQDGEGGAGQEGQDRAERHRQVHAGSGERAHTDRESARARKRGVAAVEPRRRRLLPVQRQLRAGQDLLPHGRSQHGERPGPDQAPLRGVPVVAGTNAPVSR